MKTFRVYYYDSLGRRCDVTETLSANATAAKAYAATMLLYPERVTLHARAK